MYGTRSPTPINLLNETLTISGSDQVPVYTQNNGTRRISATNFAAFVQAGTNFVDNKVTQYASPSATGFTVTIAPLTPGGGVFLLLTPTGTLAAGTITLPSGGAGGTAQDRQEILITTTQAVTALTITAGTTTVTGAPTTIAANRSFRMRYDAVNTTWYRVDNPA